MRMAAVAAMVMVMGCGDKDAETDFCHNSKLDFDKGETDQDCGGPCQSCGLVSMCKRNEDCQSGYCASAIDFNWCLSASCNNGVKDGPESDVDCGGVLIEDFCPSCDPGKKCNTDADCQSRGCLAGKCVNWFVRIHRVELQREPKDGRVFKAEWTNDSERGAFSVDAAFDACVHFRSSDVLFQILDITPPMDRNLGDCMTIQRRATPYVTMLASDAHVSVNFFTEFSSTAGYVQIVSNADDKLIAEGNYY